ncbi:MAG: M1 family metallopeptidase [Candidatus Aenigmatarchaeota archaeon]
MLPDNIKPKFYDLFLDIDEKKLTYYGKVIIDAEIKDFTDKFFLNSKGLKINKVLVNNNDCVFETNDEKEILELKLIKFLSGDIKIQIEFEGKIEENLIGIYVSKVKENEYIITTQFEPNYARRCFPCFDEPKFKSPFKLSLLINKDLKAVSNMPIKEEKILNEKKLVVFVNTPPMVTYLLYIGIGNFDFLEKGRFRVVAPPNKANLGFTSLEFCEKCLSFFEDYTGIKYPLPKLDLIAIPDFAAGAMENWGAITFREVLLLFDEKNVSEETKIKAFLVIAHELWHQWSGNLVTMKWWDDLWLNESFASYMAYKALEKLYPSLNVKNYFIFNETSDALIRDSVKSTHPIKVEVKNVNEIEEIFDEISYDKGANILRMIESFIGEENFRNAIKNFLNDFSYNVADANNLFEYFSKYSDKPVKNLIESWIKKEGYPCLEVKARGKSLKLKQKRFGFRIRDKFTWPIPLKILINGKEKEILFDKNLEIIELEEKPNNVVLNPELTSFIRVNYSKKLLEKIKPLMFKKEISSIARFSILADLYSFAKIGKISLDYYLSFIKSLELENDWLVLSLIASSIFDIERIFGYEKNIRKIPLNIFENNFKILGFDVKDNDTINEKFARKISTIYLGYSDNSEIIEKCFNTFKNFPNIKRDILSQVCFVVSMHGGKDEFNKFLEVYNSTIDPELKVISVSSMANFRNEEILIDLLNNIENKLRLQDMRIFFSSLSLNPKAALVFDWANNNLDFVKKLEKSFMIFRDFIRCLIFSTNFDRENDLNNFLKPFRKKYSMTINYLLEIRKLNKLFYQRNKDLVSSL